MCCAILYINEFLRVTNGSSLYTFCNYLNVGGFALIIFM